MEIKIDTKQVETIAGNIKIINESIRNDFENVENAINTLNKNWTGEASDEALRVFVNIQQTYCEKRFNIVNDFARFLETVVGINYDTLENKVKRAADAFK